PAQCRDPIPIGRPIANIEVYTLDPQLQAVPIGVFGQLCIGGVGLARGYLGQPAATADSFVPDPFANRTGARLYRTGDLARHSADGQINFLGRLDSQVKIRGFRVELAEIQRALCHNDALQDAIVVAGDLTAGHKQLVAYLVPNPGEAIDIGELRHSLRSLLPEYMVPAVFVPVDKIPLMPNGKADIRALPAADKSHISADTAFVAPRTPIEKSLAQIWESVLDLSGIGIHDGFFSVGGDSIQAIQVIGRAKAQDIAITLQDIIRHQSIHDLARVVEQGLSHPSQSAPSLAFSLVPEVDRESLPGYLDDAYPLTMLQEAMIFHIEKSPDSGVYHNIDSYKLQIELDIDVLSAVLQQLIAKHPVLRTSFRLTGFSRPLQLVHRSCSLPLFVEDLRHLDPARQRVILSEWFEAQKADHFDISAPPLLRIHIHRLTAETIQFNVVQHHAILDGWSLNTFLTSLFERYFSALRTPSAPPDSAPVTDVTFRDYVRLEMEALQSQECQDFWRAKLSESAMAGKCFVSNRAESTASSGQFADSLSDELSEQLLALSRSARVPLKTLLLAAHIRVVRLLSGHGDVLTGLVTDGRPEDAGADTLIGLFLNNLPFRINLNRGSWLDLFQEVLRTELEASQFRRYPLVAIQRDLGQAPLFDTFFTFTDFHVLKSLRKLSEFRLLGGSSFVRPSGTLATIFEIDPTTWPRVNRYFNYDAAAIDAEFMERIAGHYSSALACMVRDPLAQHDSAELLSGRERRQLLEEWNATQAYPALEGSLHQTFESVATLAPDSIALSLDDACVSYSQVNTRANRLAHFLLSSGVRSESIVAVCVHRSLDLIISILAVLKAGAAYLP
ncbi:MAG TPA: condensation domain-containing protein, partial [Blastocatellia bacterium]|nr:condensation domain-containing protein [Blastocatellia bacterium]